MIQFEIPTNQSSILKVVGIGGGGGNAVNHMFNQNIDGVNFIICNTDAQALACSNIPNKVQLGPMLTAGLGAGANPQIGRQATEESLEEIRKILEENTKMAFITAGMGGGTGTGGAPIVAKICKDLGILTVGIVTTPFTYEGKKRQIQAEEGIQQLKQYVDTLLIISNDKLRHQYGNLKMHEAFEKADNVLATAAKCITDVINSTGQINVDFADVCTVMKNGGVAILGNASVSGEDRAQHAIEDALNSPLLNDNEIKGAKWILININSARGEHEFTMDEVEVIQSYLLSKTGDNSDVILGLGYDDTLEDKIGITLIATGFDNQDTFVKPILKKQEIEEGKIVMSLQPKMDESPIVILPASNMATSVEKEVIVDSTASVNTPLTIESLAPALVEDSFMFNTPMPTIEDVTDTENNEPIHFNLYDPINENNHKRIEQDTVDIASANKDIEIDRAADAFYSTSIPTEKKVEKITPFEFDSSVNNSEENQSSTKPVLAKPVNIYADESSVSASANNSEIDNTTSLQEVKNSETELPTSTLFNLNEFDKEEREEVKPAPKQVAVLFEDERQTQMDEAEKQRQKQLDRLKKLRELSFDVNANDPNSEFENVPAYVRKNMDLYNNTNPVEAFYSKLEVKADDKNYGQLDTINTFLDGKKPD